VLGSCTTDRCSWIQHRGHGHVCPHKWKWISYHTMQWFRY